MVICNGVHSIIVFHAVLTVNEGIRIPGPGQKSYNIQYRTSYYATHCFCQRIIHGTLFSFSYNLRVRCVSQPASL